MTINDGILCLWPHFLSVDCRKSRNNSFSIFNRLFSYLYSANVFAGFRPRAFGMPRTSFFRSRLRRLCIGRSPSKPNSLSISRWLWPSANFASMTGSNACIFVYLRFSIENPPWCYFPTSGGILSIVRFYWTCSLHCRELFCLKNIRWVSNLKVASVDKNSDFAEGDYCWKNQVSFW